MAATTQQRWTFITNHGLVLSYIFRHPRSTAREISLEIGVTERTTHKIISDLESTGYIERRKNGRRNVYRVDPKLPHHSKQGTIVEQLLEALMDKPPRQQGRSTTTPAKKSYEATPKRALR